MIIPSHDREIVTRAADQHGWKNLADGETHSLYGYGLTRISVTYDPRGELSGATGYRETTILGDTEGSPSVLAALTTLKMWIREFAKVERQLFGREAAPEVPVSIQDVCTRATARVEYCLGASALGMLGPALRNALMHSEVLREIARDEDINHPAVRLARHAVNCQP